MERGGYSLMISIIRLVIIALPAAWILAKYASNKEIVFIAFPIAEFCGMIAVWLMKQKMNRELKQNEI
jgi:Na+-driven multidrug efflux pump